MKYIAIRRIKIKSLLGYVNIPYGAVLSCESGVLTLDNVPICGDHSQNAYRYFARNDDGNGLERGELTSLIVKTLANNDENHQSRWDIIWEDAICQKYKRKDYDDYWLWSHDFYNADINDIRHIASILDIKY